MLKPLRDSFLFSFFNETVGGRIVERNRQGLILTNQGTNVQSSDARWGKVLAVGPEVKDFKVGDIVLIEYGKWTVGFKYDNVQIWKSDEKKVIALGDDESVTFAY
jgi:hypothetical protein